MNEIVKCEENQIESVKLREYSNRLVLSGWGIVVLGAWEFVRIIMGMFLFRRQITEFISTQLEAPSDEVQYWVFALFVVIIIIVMAISLLFNIYIGKSAIADGRGKKRKNLYLLFAAGILVLAFLSVQAQMQQAETQEQQTETQEQSEEQSEEQEWQDMDTVFVTNLLDFMLYLTCAEMLYCAARVRILRRKLRQKEAQ